jgi:glutathione S-transferase
LVETSPSEGVSAEYLKLNKLGKVPTFEGADGFVLSESVAIAVYRECPAPFLAASYDVECFYHSVIPV